MCGGKILNYRTRCIVKYLVIVGLNSKRHKLTIASFYRWIGSLDEKEPKPNFLIWRIEVIKFDVLSYAARRIGFPPPRASNDLMEPGDYTVYSGECRHSISDHMSHGFIN